MGKVRVFLGCGERPRRGGLGITRLESTPSLYAGKAGEKECTLNLPGGRGKGPR